MTAGCLRPSASLLPQPVTSGLTEQGKVCNRYSLSSHLPHSGRKNAFSCRQCFGPRQRLRVISYAEYDRGAPQYRSRFGSTTPTGVTSAVQSVSFNQQVIWPRNFDHLLAASVVDSLTICVFAVAAGAEHTSFGSWTTPGARSSNHLRCHSFCCIQDTSSK